MDLPSTHHKGERERDVARWISVLKMLTDEINTIETVIPGHGGLRDKESLKLHYDYFSEIYERIDDMKRKGVSMEMVKDSLSIEKGFSHFTQFENLSDDDKERHLKNLEVFWNYMEKNE